MEDSKPWYASKGIWGGIIAAVTAALAAFGVTITESDQESLVQSGLALVAAVSAVLGVYGRAKASKKLSK